MKPSSWPPAASVITLVLIVGLMVGLNLVWLRQPNFPIYGYLADACIVVVMLYIIFRMRRWKAEAGDEFIVTKRRLAAQTGIMLGFILYAISNALPFFFPETSRAFIGSMDGPMEGFIIGRVFGMAPFVMGLLIGQVVTWVRYR